MTITAGDLTTFAVNRLATGHIQQFGTTALGYVYLNYTYTYSSGTYNGQWARVRPINTPVTAGNVRDGITDLPGGGVFDPWGTARERSPIGYPVYSMQLFYDGNVLPVQLEYEKLMKLVGVTAELTFGFGAKTGGSYSSKACPAKLLAMTATAERVLAPGASPAHTWIQFSVTWKQVGEFYL